MSTSAPSAPVLTPTAVVAQFRCTVQPGDILEAFSSLSVVRHANAVKAASGTADHGRQLSETGKSQAVYFGAWLDLQRIPDRVYSSPARRVRETLEIGLREASIGEAEIQFLSHLGVVVGDTHPLNVMFAELSYAPLKGGDTARGYFDHQLGDHLKDWAFRAVEVLMGELNEPNFGLDVLVGCHAVFSPAILWAMNEILGESNEHYVANAALLQAVSIGEAEVLTAEFHPTTGTMKVEHVSPSALAEQAAA